MVVELFVEQFEVWGLRFEVGVIRGMSLSTAGGFVVKGNNCKASEHNTKS